MLVQLDKFKMAKIIGLIPENVNFGIKPIVIAFAEEKKRKEAIIVKIKFLNNFKLNLVSIINYLLILILEKKLKIKKEVNNIKKYT